MDQRSAALPAGRRARRRRLRQEDHPRALARALYAGVSAAWATASEFYGNDRGLRRGPQARRLGYVLAVVRNHRVTLAAGIAQVDHVANQLPARSWNRRSAGKGAKGERDYDWVWARIQPPADEAGHSA